MPSISALLHGHDPLMHAHDRLREGVYLDLEAKRGEYVFRFPHAIEKQLLGLLNDPRDLPIVILLLNILLTVVPAAAVVLYFESHLMGCTFLVINYAVYLQRYLVALLHVTEHKCLFKKGQLVIQRPPCTSQSHFLHTTQIARHLM
jgi:hypothetical protein